jgi:hypothetical protein
LVFRSVLLRNSLTSSGFMDSCQSVLHGNWSKLKPKQLMLSTKAHIPPQQCIFTTKACPLWVTTCLA